MSTIEKQIQEELVIRKAKYKVKNSLGKYEIVYLETSADQVEETSNKVFVTPEQKTQIGANKSAIEAETQARTQADSALSERLKTIEGEGEGSVKKALIDAKAYTDTKVQEVNGVNEALAGRVTTAESDIANLKDTVSNKNNNTIVVNTEEEISKSNANPKIGDLAFVISSKRAYIYKGEEALTAKNAPQGWVVFDEITNELDLVNYLKKTEAESTYRKIVDKIAKSDLDTSLTNELNGKLNSEQVDAKISTAVNPVSEKASANEAAITKEVSDRKGEITRVEGLVTNVNNKADAIDSAYKAADTVLTQRLNKFAPIVASEEPVGTETGHVWLEIQAEV